MNYIDEKFADIQLLRYKLEGFEALRLQQKYIYIICRRLFFQVEISRLTNLENIILAFARCLKVFSFFTTAAVTLMTFRR